MSFTYFIGIDVSKKTIDAAIFSLATKLFHHQQFDNKPSGFQKLLTWVAKHSSKQQAVYCLEHTAAADRRNLCPTTLLLFHST